MVDTGAERDLSRQNPIFGAAIVTPEFGQDYQAAILAKVASRWEVGVFGSEQNGVRGQCADLAVLVVDHAAKID